jgi:hypothetical protein
VHTTHSYLEPRLTSARGSPPQLMMQTATAGFEEKAEVHMRMNIDPKYTDQQLRTTVTMPSGTGNVVRVAVLAQGDKVRSETSLHPTPRVCVSAVRWRSSRSPTWELPRRSRVMSAVAGVYLLRCPPTRGQLASRGASGRRTEARLAAVERGGGCHGRLGRAHRRCGRAESEGGGRLHHRSLLPHTPRPSI